METQLLVDPSPSFLWREAVLDPSRRKNADVRDLEASDRSG